MEIVFVLLPLSLLLVAIAFVAYVWALRTGQFDDLDTPARRMVVDEDTESGGKKKQLENMDKHPPSQR